MEIQQLPKTALYSYNIMRVSKWDVGAFYHSLLYPRFQLVLSLNLAFIHFLWITNLSNFIVVLEKFLQDKFSTKTLYFFTFLIYAICSGAIFFQKNIYIIMGLSSTLGLVITTLSTLPYQMIAEFHKDKNYRKQSAEGTRRGIGKQICI